MDYISDGEKKEAVIAKPPQPPNVPKNVCVRWNRPGK